MSPSLRSIELYHVAVPLKGTIRHASHERIASDNLVVRVTLSDGQTGYGEGVPRSYVTGETIDTTFATLAALDVPRQLGRPSSYLEVVRGLEALTIPSHEADPRRMAGNAARCALELALLDAYGRHFGESLGRAILYTNVPDLRRNETPTRVRYSGAITAATDRKERISAWKMWLYGFAQVKLKVGVAGQDDPVRVARLRKILGRRMDLRLDANESWHTSEVVERVRPLLPFRPTALEQPVPHAEVDALAGLRPRLGVPVMLDESLCGLPDALRSIEAGTADLFNIRLSKCGGIVPSLQIAGLAQRSGIGLQLGCHPGETGILSAAGRHFATHVRDLRYVEGSYDRHVLAANLTVEDPTFGYGGWARPIRGPGLGVHVQNEELARLTQRHQVIPYE
jgi:muconate cycloisomerase